MLYRFHDYTVDPAGREVQQGTQRLALEPKVFEVLLYLLEHRDRSVPKDELLAQCWPETFVSESALTRCLSRLRNAVQPTPTAPPVIETRHRHGYRFVADVTVLTQPPPPAPDDTARLQTAAPAVPQVGHDTPVLPAPLASAPLPTPPRRPASSGAERRQLTVLFCDVVDSTSLAGQLDPEDYRDVMGRYHATCTAVIQRYGGHVAQQYLGDGLLVYFGWPQAHEDDARRAVHASLALVTAIHDLSSALMQDYGIRLAIRIGIHTGLVVVGAGEEHTPYGHLAVGATPNLAAKIQALAAPDAVVISATTYHLVQGYFVCASLGEHALPGTPEPSVLYQVRQASAARGRLDVTPPPQRTPFVGREVELAVLRERAAQVRQGLGQVVLLSGEAGIGKSRLVQEVSTACAAEGFTVIACHCSPYAQETAFHPVIAWLQHRMQDHAETPVAVRLARLETLVQQAQLDGPANVPLLAALVQLDLPDACYPVPQLTPPQQRQRTLDTLVALVVGLAARQPVVFLVEDLHWSDPTTLEWLGLLLAQGPTAPLLTLLTCRPTFLSPWSGRAHVTLLSVPRLATPQVEQMVHTLGGDGLAVTQRHHLIRQTDGVPLFIEEVTKFVLAAQRLHGQPGRPAAPSVAPEIAIPATLRDALMARLDQLGPAKGTAQLGATIGREFSSGLLQAVTPLEEDLLRQDVHQLVEAELLYQRGVGATATYQFKHALVQEAAYASLLRTTRQHYHRHIAQVLETQFPDTVATQPELLAHHYTEAGLAAQAIPYWQRAAQHAIARSALPEVIGHLTKGLALLKTLPETPEQARQELECLTTLGPTLIATKGHAAPEVTHVYTRAQALCHQVGDRHQRLLTLNGLRRGAMVQAAHRTAQELAEHLLSLAQQHQEPGWLLEAHLAVAQSGLFLGEFVAARAAFASCLALYNPQQHLLTPALYPRDTAVTCWATYGRLLWVLGYPEQALQWGQKALTLAHDLAHPFSVTIARFFMAEIHQVRREAHAAQQQVEAALALCAEHGFEFFRARGTILRGWSLALQGQGEDGMAQLREGLAAYQATGAANFRPYYALLQAEAYGPGGDPGAGVAVLAEALASIEHTQERWWAAELHRCTGDLLLHAGHSCQGTDHQHPGRDAEQHMAQALAIARHQQARSLELRAAVSLSRLWHQQGQRAQARQLLTEVYGWFTEGLDTADLQEARTLLAALA